MRSVAFAVAMVVFGASSAAWAASPPPQEPVAKKKIAFAVHTLSTAVLDPSPLVIEGSRRGLRSSLIEVREDFVPELLRQADGI